MKNLLLNVVRSFKKNKISIIGLIFLIFFGLGVFVVMSNTTANITNEYTSLASEGQLHNFTVSELYDTGNSSFAPHTKGVVYTAINPITEQYQVDAKVNDYSEYDDQHITTTALFTGEGLGQTAGQQYYIALPEQTKYQQEDEITFVRSYHIILDPVTSTGLYQKFAETEVPKKSRLVDFIIKTSNHYESSADVPEELNTYQTLIDNWSQLTDEQCLTLSYINIFHDDYDTFIKAIGYQSQTIFNVMTTTNTPLANKLTDSYADQLDFRFFKSVNVTATDDNIFYKVIDSNPNDTIDKVVLFKDTTGRTGNYLFNTSDCAPYDSFIEFYDENGVVLTPGDPIQATTTVSFNVPFDYSDVATIPLYSHTELNSWNSNAKYVYSQILQVRFKRMLSAKITTDSVKPYLKNLAGRDFDRDQYYESFFNSSSTIYTTYSNYLADWYNGGGESITISNNGNVVFSWVEFAGTPQTCTVANWTSRFSIINPQHLEKNDKRVLDPSTLNSFTPFKEWFNAVYGSYPGGEINQSVAQNWFNSLTQDQLSFWIDPYVDSEWVTMSYDIPGWDNPLVVARGTNTGQWSGIDEQFKVDCGGFNQIIWGCGLSPDFMYPVVDISRPTPNTKTECLVYCNEMGYSGIKLAFINATVEEYVVGRFKQNVSQNQQQTILNEINVWAQTNMIFPENVRAAYFANDTSNLLNCSGFRVAYIPNLVSVINVVSTILCSFIGVLTLIICFVIIKRYVENNRVNIGIMRANGIKKSRIALSLLPFALLPALIGGIGAYLAGLFLQAPALSLFSNYWMLPTPLIAFSWLPFLCCIFIPFLIFSLICFITTLMVLRVSSVELMKSGSEFKTNSFSRIVKKPFKHFGVLTRFRVALAFNSITRLLMLAAMSCLTMSSLVFAFTTFDKLNQSRITNSTQFDYSFNVELTTPTSSGSIYSIYDYSDPLSGELVKGYGWSDPSQYMFNTSWDTTVHGATPQPWWTYDGVTSYKELTKWYSSDTLDFFDPSYKNTIGGNGNIVLPTIADSTGQNIDLFYLNNKMCSKLTLDHNIGVPGIASSNPWEIALALMPANSRNIAADDFNIIVNLAGHKVDSANNTFIAACMAEGLNVDENGCIWLDQQEGMTYEQVVQHINAAAVNAGIWCYPSEYTGGTILFPRTYWKNAFTTFTIKGADGTYKLTTDILAITNLYVGFNNAFIQFIKNIYQDPEMMKYEYPITYGTLPLNWDNVDGGKKDELYTYVTSTINSLSSGQSFDKGHEIKIEGIIENSQFIRLTDSNGNVINSWLFDQNYLDSLNADENVYPIIVNAYAAHKYKLHRGDTITVNVTNTVDRFEQKIHPDLYKEDANQAIFKVVGISQGTNNEAFYTTQKAANDILGLPNGDSWNKTHKYMMWSTSEWSTSNLPKLADLAGVEADTDHISIYSFDGGSEQIDKTKPKLSDTSIKTPIGFNGIYTQNKFGKPITAGMSLYSYTGMYPATSVFKSAGNNKMEDLLVQNNNLSIANLVAGFRDPELYQANANFILHPETEDAYRENYVRPFINRLADIYGETTMITSLAGAMDVAASDLVYANLISTFDLAEASIMSIIIPITIIIVAIISNLIINDSKKMAAMLKALGYSDSKNLMSILALFVPTIVLGVALAIPLSIGLTLGYQSIIFNTANILVDVTQKWWYYVAAVGGIGTILIGTYAIGFASLKRNRLVDQIK